MRGSNGQGEVGSSVKVQSGAGLNKVGVGADRQLHFKYTVIDKVRVKPPNLGLPQKE